MLSWEKEEKMGIDIPEFMKVNSEKSKIYYMDLDTIQEVRRRYKAMQDRLFKTGVICSTISFIIGALISLAINS